MIKNNDIICFSTSDWENPWGSKQQLMLRLSSANRILYVEYQASILHMLNVLFFINRIKKWSHNPRRVNENLYVFTPLPCLPFGFYFRSVNRLNQLFLSLCLMKAFNKMGFKKPILWVYTPLAVDILRFASHSLVVYHCIADFANEKKIAKRMSTIAKMEKELVEKCALVFALTKSLCDYLSKVNTNTYYFPSAVDYEMFNSSCAEDAQEPEDIKEIRRPRIGIVTYLHDQLDLSLLSYIADERKNWSLVIIGKALRTRHDLSRLFKKKNVFFLGEKKHHDIPRYIKSFDVCLIPYVKNEYTDNVSPLKLCEYLSMGKPVVSSGLESLLEFRDTISLCETKEEFLRQINRYIEHGNNDQSIITKRKEVAQQNSWDKRIELLTSLLEESCAKERNNYVS